MSNLPPTAAQPPQGGPTPGHGAPPPGPPPGPPGGFSGPAGPGGSRFTRTHLVALGTVIAILLAAIGGVLIFKSDDAEAEEIFLEPVGTPGDDPFTTSVDVDTDVDVQQAIDAQARADAGSGVQTYSGGQPGLYGGTQSSRHCDKGQLVTFLEANAGKAGAWAAVHGITTGQIPAFVADLTPVLLREDTRVTNHGFVSGAANPIPAVLQAGTAVLIDRFGRPVVKCACGNPLVAPSPSGNPRYTGTRWSGFSSTTITVVQQTTVEVDVFVLTDPVTGDRFRRPAGTDGDADTSDEDEPPATTTTTAPPATLPPQTLPPPPPVTEAPAPAPSFGARGELEARLAQCSGVVFPFEEHVSEVVEVESTGQTTIERVTLIGTTASGGQQFFSWLYDEVDGSLTPDSPLAQEAAQHCSALSG